jgi:DNA-3-methyladenine glycosylase I
MPMTGSDVVVSGLDGRRRCWWCGDDPLYCAYHDDEWGRPVRDDRALFEKICLEGFQAGLSWITVLRKREAFRRAFGGFHPASVAALGEEQVNDLMTDAGIIRHRGKIEAVIGNARRMLEDFPGPGDFTAFVWGFAPTAPRERPASRDAIAAETPESTALSRELRSRGWRFVGPTTMHAFMQSMGLVDDHLVGCDFVPEPQPPRRS